MGDTLVLLKSARAKQFFQQNMALLAQPEGYGSATRYKQRWAHHAPDDPLPQRVLIVFGDPPYTHFLPVREATLERCEWDEMDQSYDYSLTLGPLLAPEGLAESGDWLLRHRPSADAFVFAAAAPPLAAPRGTPEARWRALASYLASPTYAAENNAYARAIFAFAHPLAEAGGGAVEPRAPLRVGRDYAQRLSILAPGLSADELAAVEVQADFPPLAARVNSQGSARDGAVTLHIQPLQPLDTPWPLSVLFRPAALPSGPIHLLLPPIARLLTAAETPAGERGAIERLPLYEWLTERLDERDQLKLLDRFLLPQPADATADPRLLLARAALLRREGRAGEALATLLSIPDAQRSDEALVLLFECAVAAQRHLPYMQLLEGLSDWDDRQRVQRLAQAIAHLPEEAILPVVARVCQLAPVYAHLLWQTVGGALRDSDHRLALARFLQGEEPPRATGLLALSPDEVYHYLARGADAQRLTDGTLDYLVAVGLRSANPGGLAPFVIEWMQRHLRRAERDEVRAARATFEQATPWLSQAQAERGVALLVEALRRTGQTEDAVWLTLGRAEQALRALDFDRAETILRDTRTLIGDMPADNRSDMLNFIKELDASLKQTRQDVAASHAPRHGSDPGLAAILRLYSVECVDAFWADLADVLHENDHVARQFIERLDQLQAIAHHSGSMPATVHALTMLGSNVARMELTDSARLVFKKVGRSVRLIALYAHHDAYEEALKQRWELMNRIQRG